VLLEKAVSDFSPFPLYLIPSPLGILYDLVRFAVIDHSWKEKSLGRTDTVTPPPSLPSFFFFFSFFPSPDPLTSRPQWQSRPGHGSS